MVTGLGRVSGWVRIGYGRVCWSRNENEIFGLGHARDYEGGFKPRAPIRRHPMWG